MRAVVAALCAAMTVAGLACGEDSESPSSAGPDGMSAASLPGNVIRDREIRDAVAGSPKRSLLQFFQAVQFQDVEAATELVTRGERRAVGPNRLKRAVGAIGSNLGRPRIVRLRRDGDRVVARVIILGFDPGETEPVSSSPTTFTLTRGGDRLWRLSDVSYLIAVSDNYVASRRKKQAR